jgi:putative transcriptional regulator
MTNLRHHRRARGMRQSDLADLLRVDQTTVSLWENGQALPRRRSAAALQAIFGVPLAELLQNDDDRPEGAAVKTIASPAKDMGKISDGS